jgi:hypothetical protein
MAGREFSAREKTFRRLKSDNKTTAGFIGPVFVSDMEQSL